ncbi:hypothetical protein ACJX0J_007375, partial [Zea mays]
NFSSRGVDQESIKAIIDMKIIKDQHQTMIMIPYKSKLDQVEKQVRGLLRFEVWSSKLNVSVALGAVILECVFATFNVLKDEQRRLGLHLHALLAIMVTAHMKRELVIFLSFLILENRNPLYFYIVVSFHSYNRVSHSVAAKPAVGTRTYQGSEQQEYYHNLNTHIN